MKRRISENAHRTKGISRMKKRSRKHEKQVRALYLDLPPEALVGARVGVNAVMDCGELERARWFWKRQPNQLILPILKARMIAIVYVVLFVLLVASLCVKEQPLVAALILGVTCLSLSAIGLAAFIDIFCYLRWKSDYSRAISRLLETVRR
jgi:hypothetical protein